MKTKLYRTLDSWSRDMLNFYFLEKYLGIFCSAHLVPDFSRKIFLKLCSINWPNFIAWLPLLLDKMVECWINVWLNGWVFGYDLNEFESHCSHLMFIAIVRWPGCDVINFEITLIFLIKLFFYMTKKSRQKYKYLENKKSF